MGSAINFTAMQTLFDQKPFIQGILIYLLLKNCCIHLSKYFALILGISSHLIVDGAFVAKFDVEMIEQHGTNSLCSEYYENRMRSYLEEARKLIAERKAACADWCFSYELGNPPPSMVHHNFFVL